LQIKFKIKVPSKSSYSLHHRFTNLLLHQKIISYLSYNPLCYKFQVSHDLGSTSFFLIKFFHHCGSTQLSFLSRCHILVVDLMDLSSRCRYVSFLIFTKKLFEYYRVYLENSMCLLCPFLLLPYALPICHFFKDEKILQLGGEHSYILILFKHFMFLCYLLDSLKGFPCKKW